MPTTANTFTLHLRVPPTPRYARSARTALIAFASHHDVDSRDLENLTFAMGEALANAIEHGRGRDDIDVGLRIDDQSIVATVSDRGQGFEDQLRGLATLPHELAEQGRGFAIMQRCTDFFDVRSKPGEGTVVTLGRYRRRHQEAKNAC